MQYNKTVTLKVATALLCIFTMSFNSNAQFAKMGFPFIYIEEGAAVGVGSMEKLAISCIFPKSNIVTLGVHLSWRNTPNLPSDYKGIDFQYNDNGLLVASLNTPQQVSEMVSLMYGKVYFTNSKRLRFILRGGIIFGTVITPGNFVTNDPNNFISSSSEFVSES